VNQDSATIVIVDDAPEVRLLLRTQFRLNGRLRVVGEGADGAAAIQLAAEHQPALMLLDVSMPGVDGLQALPQVREASPGTRVFLYSGFEEQGLVEKAHELGAAGFIVKSASPELLVERLLGPPDAEQRSGSSVPATAGSGRPADEVETVDTGVLDEHLERFREVFEEAAIGMATMTLTGLLIRANRALAALVQRPAEDLVGTFYGDLTDDDQDLVTKTLEAAREGPLDVLQLEHGLAKDAQGRQVRATLAPVRDSRGRALYHFLQVQDVTAERAAMEELRKSEERFRLLVEAVEDYAIFMLDPTGHVMSWNSGAQRSKGYAAEEIIGRHFRTFYPPEVAERKHPEHELAIALEAGHYEEEGWRVRKDGSQFWANVLITAVFNPAGEHIGFAKVTRDTTQRKNLEQERTRAVEALAAANGELEALNARLQQAAEDQSQFLAVTAHELRTPVGVLGGSAETLAKHWADLGDEDREELFEAMAASTGRLRRLLADLLTASRLQSSALAMRSEPTLVTDVLYDAIMTVRRTHPDDEIVADIPEGLTVTADRDRLTQALDNLLSNALRHGRPPVTVTAVDRSTAVEIRVSDQGGGVSDAVAPRLFERFATGLSKGGTGLGLFIVRELARAHGGEARYDLPSPGAPSGAFVIVLPRTPAGAGDEAVGTGRVAVVETDRRYP
jgi:PAS domain S-box-containing protein